METFRSKEQWLAGVTEAIKNEVIDNDYTIDDTNRTSRKTQLMELATSKIATHKVTKQIGKDSIDIDQKCFEPIWSQSILSNIDIAMADASAIVKLNKANKAFEEWVAAYKPQLPIGEALWRQLFFITASESNMNNATLYLRKFYMNLFNKEEQRAYVLSAQELGQQGKTTWLKHTLDILNSLNIPSIMTPALPNDKYVPSTFASYKAVGVSDEPFRYIDYESLNSIIDKQPYTVNQKFIPSRIMDSKATLAICTNHLPTDGNSARWNVVSVYTGYGDSSMIDEYSGWKNIPSSDAEMHDFLLPAVQDCVYYAYTGTFDVAQFATVKKSSNANIDIKLVSAFIDYTLEIKDKSEVDKDTFKASEVAKAMYAGGFTDYAQPVLRAKLGDMFKKMAVKQISKGGSRDYMLYKIDLQKLYSVYSGIEQDSSGNKETVYNFYHKGPCINKDEPEASGSNPVNLYNYTSISSTPSPKDEINTNDIKREACINCINSGSNKLDSTVHAYYESDEYQHAQPAVWDETNLSEDDHRQEFMLLNTPLSQKPTGTHKTINTNDNVKQDNFLFECDGLSLDEQKKQLSNLPEEVYKSVHSAIYSGNKSVHVIITTNFGEQKGIIPGSEYTNRLRKLLWNKLNDKYFGGNGDPACSNAARLTRAPNVVRADTGNLQDCIIWNDHPAKLDVNGMINVIKYQMMCEEQTNKIEHDKHSNKQYGEKTEEQKLAAYAKARPEKWQPVLDLLDGKDLGSGANYIGYIGMLKAAEMPGLASQAAEMAHNLHPSNIGFKHI